MDSTGVVQSTAVIPTRARQRCVPNNIVPDLAWEYQDSAKPGPTSRVENGPLLAKRSIPSPTEQVVLSQLGGRLRVPQIVAEDYALAPSRPDFDVDALRIKMSAQIENVIRKASADITVRENWRP